MAIDEVPLEQLRQRRSVKWRYYSAGVLPAWVAEMDFTLAPAIAEALHAAVDRSDTGYRWEDEVPEALVAFAAEQWQWQVAQDRVLVLADVMSGIAQSLMHLTEPGDHVVINPPVYPPFFSTVERVAHRTIREVPLQQTEDGYQIDVAATEQAFADPRVRAYVLCSPHNPTGTVHSEAILQTIAELAAAHGVLVIADEIHAPLTLPGTVHTPYLSLVDDDARAVSCLSASKSWNIPGLKCAQVVGTDRTLPTLKEQVPIEATFGIGHFGVLGTLAAYRSGREWLAQAVSVLDDRRTQLAVAISDLADAGISWTRPQASYLAWIRIEGLGDDPAEVIKEAGYLALTSGVPFGAPGTQHARINFATSTTLLAEIMETMGSVVRRSAS